MKNEVTIQVQGDVRVNGSQVALIYPDHDSPNVQFRCGIIGDCRIAEALREQDFNCKIWESLADANNEVRAFLEGLPPPNATTLTFTTWGDVIADGEKVAEIFPNHHPTEGGYEVRTVQRAKETHPFITAIHNSPIFATQYATQRGCQIALEELAAKQ